ncbi:MAG: hypothetical protein R6V06_10905, partial [Kiritimatiellia bacterium]
HAAYTVQGGRHFFDSGTTCVFKKGISPIGDPMTILCGSGTMIFEDKVNLGSGGRFYADQWTRIYLNVSSNIWGLTTFGRGNLIMNAVNALPENTSFTLALSYGPYGTLDLNGYDQTIKEIIIGTTDPGDKIIKSGTPAVLTLTDSGTRSVEIDFKGAAGLRKGGDGNLTLTGTESDTTGDFIVDAGTLTVADGSSLGNSTNIVVNGGAIHIEGEGAITADAALFINDYAYMNIEPNVYPVVDRFFVDGVERAPGEWGSTESGAEYTDDAHFQGEGMLIVTPPDTPDVTDAVWDAGAPDNNITSADNWAGDVAPAFDGSDKLIFGSAGSTSVVDSVVSAYGLQFNQTEDFVISDGGGELILGDGGLLAESTDSVSRTYAVEADMEVKAFNNIWEVNCNDASSVLLDISGDISSVNWLYETHVVGDGHVSLSGNNSFSGDFFVETGCVVNVCHDNALGSTNAPTTVKDGGMMYIYGGVNVSENLTLLYGDKATGYAGVLRSNGGSNIWSGEISCHSSRIRVASGSLDILGGVTHGSVIAVALSGTHMRVAEKPLSIGSGTFYAHSSGGPLIIAAAGNTAGKIDVRNSELRFEVSDAFNTTVTWQIANNGGVVNLNGYDQEIGRLLTPTSTADGSARIYSDTPATLTVNQSSDDDFAYDFRGALSFVKKGASELRLYDTHSTTGTLTVAEGTLTMKSGSSFTAVPLVSVTGGTLALEDGTTLNDGAALSIEDSGVVDVDAGLTEYVGELFIDGDQKSAGTWGAAGSGAQNIDDTHFSGTGVIKVLHDNRGTVIVIY